MADHEQKFKDAIDKFLEALSGPRRRDPFDGYARLVGPVETFCESASTPMNTPWRKSFVAPWTSVSRDVRQHPLTCVRKVPPNFSNPATSRPTKPSLHSTAPSLGHVDAKSPDTPAMKKAASTLSGPPLSSILQLVCITGWALALPLYRAHTLKHLYNRSNYHAQHLVIIVGL
jgi:hypothetical protein